MSALGQRRPQIAALVGIHFTPNSRHWLPELPLSFPKQSLAVSLTDVCYVPGADIHRHHGPFAALVSSSSGQAAQLLWLEDVLYPTVITSCGLRAVAPRIAWFCDPSVEARGTYNADSAQPRHARRCTEAGGQAQGACIVPSARPIRIHSGSDWMQYEHPRPIAIPSVRQRPAR